MGQNNAAVRQWFGNRARFADLFNGVIFDGEQIVLPEDLEKIDSEAAIVDLDKEGASKEIRRHRDIVMRWNQGAELVVLACENQERVHYAMPVRNMLYDSLSYTEQIQNQWKNRTDDEKKNLSSEEFLSQHRKNDHIFPVITIVVYYGKEEWDGNLELYEMFGDGFEHKEKLHHFIPNYKINLINVAHPKNMEKFQTDLQEVLGMLQYRNQKDELLRYLNSREQYFRHVDRDTYFAIRAFLNSEKVLKSNIQMDKEETDMCKALEDLLNEGIEKGIEQGENNKLLEQVRKKYAMGQSAEKIAEDLVEKLEKVESILSLIKGTV